MNTVKDAIDILDVLFRIFGPVLEQALAHHGFKRVEEIRPETGRAAAVVDELEGKSDR